MQRYKLLNNAIKHVHACGAGYEPINSALRMSRRYLSYSISSTTRSTRNKYLHYALEEFWIARGMLRMWKGLEE